MHPGTDGTHVSDNRKWLGAKGRANIRRCRFLLDTFQNKLGPGLLFAASAVGTSHLVQSTRAGGDYGFSLVWLIILACLIKYPAFVFGAEYAAATRKTLIDSYEQQGRWVMVVYALTLPIDMFIATAAVSLVCAGIFKHIFAINLGDISVTSILLVCCAVLLLTGKYRVFESITKLFVVLFSILVLVASALVLPELNWSGDRLLRPLTLERQDSLFYVALAGWMPTAIAASVFQSIWVCEKSKDLGRPLTRAEARFDFNVGYFSTMFLALCFVLLGTALLFRSNVPVAAGASGFAAQLIDIFTQAIGGWAYPVIGLTTMFVMISTVLTLLDACPRAAATIINRLRTGPGGTPAPIQAGQYLLLSVIQVSGSILFLLMFLNSFKAFIDLATSIAFLSAPVIAFFNHRAMFGASVPADQQPGAFMKSWSIGGIILLSAFALWFLGLRLWWWGKPGFLSAVACSGCN